MNQYYNKIKKKTTRRILLNNYINIKDIPKNSFKILKSQTLKVINNKVKKKQLSKICSKKKKNSLRKISHKNAIITNNKPENYFKTSQYRLKKKTHLKKKKNLINNKETKR